MKTWIGTGAQGALVDPEQARISAFDHGFTVGDGIFETMKLQGGRVFLWPWHLERLRLSAAAMELQLPADAVLSDIVLDVARMNAREIPALGRLRLTISAGVGPLGSARDAVQPTVTCAASPMPVRTGAAAVHLAPWPRNERSPLAGVKSTSYAENVLALAQAARAGASEAVFFNTRDELCEGTGSNLFIVAGGRVLTPPTSAGLLAGVTRRFVLGLTGQGLVMEEAPISRAAFEAADEVFLTSTFQDVRSVARINARPMAAGPVTAELQRRFRAAAAADWCWH